MNQDNSLALHTDLYQINMAETYWRDGIHNQTAVFDLFFRDLPFHSGYAVFAGLERIIDFLENYRFSEDDLEYLKSVGYKDDFLGYLKDLRFTGNIRSMKEGEIVFPSEPLLRVEAPLAEAQLIETALLNIVNYQTLIASKASRIRQVTNGDTVIEFGTRRAQEMDAGVWGARAAVIGGFDATSNVRAAKLFHLPTAGTHAHSMVQAYRDEYMAFHKYAEAHKDCVFLVDTYDVLKSGVPNAIKVARELGDQINFKAIRLDSGDLAYLSKASRRMLDEAGFTETEIFASNDLDEETIVNLKSQGAVIDSWGIGTKLITAFDQPALGAVYKLVAIEDGGELVDTIKISANPEKITTPGKKRVHRIINTKTGMAEGDYITLEDEEPEKQDELNMFHPIHTHLSKTVSDFEAVDLHEDIFKNGERVYTPPEVSDIKAYSERQLKLFWDEYKRILNPEGYPVDLSDETWHKKMETIREIKRTVKEKAQTKK